MKVKITQDLFDIATRIKELDERYEIYYDTDSKKYYIYAFGIRQLTLPYDKLDVRTLDYVYETRVENTEKILREIDEYNKRSERDSVKKAQNEFENECSRRFRLSKI